MLKIKILLFEPMETRLVTHMLINAASLLYLHSIFYEASKNAAFLLFVLGEIHFLFY